MQLSFKQSVHSHRPTGPVFKKLATALAGVVVAACASTALAATTLTYTDHDPAAGMRPQFLANVWFPQIAETSNDDIKVNATFGGALFGSQEALGGVSKGIADMGMIYAEFYPSQLPSFTILPLFPSGPDNFNDILWFYHELLEKVPAFSEDLNRLGIKPLMITVGLPGAFAGTYKIDSLDDLKGHKWRAPGKWRQKLVRDLGAEPVSVPWEDIFMSLQTGTMDGVLTNYDGLHQMKFDEAAKNVMTSKEFWWPVPFLHVINQKKFDSLSPEDQEALLKASAETERQFHDLYSNTFDKIRQEEEAAGIRFVPMPEKDIQTWTDGDTITKLRQEWVEDMQAAGMKNADEVMKQVVEIHTEAIHRGKQ